MFDVNQPLWLPKGSIRAVLALALVGGFMAGMISQDVALLVIGSYFAMRTAIKD